MTLSDAATDFAAWLVTHEFTATVLLVGGVGFVGWVGCSVAWVLYITEMGRW